MPNNEQRRAAAKRKLERQLVRRQERAKKRRTVAIIATGLAVVLIAGGVYFLATHDFSSGDAAASETTPPAPITIPTEIKPLAKRPTPLAEKVSCEYRKEENPAKQVNLPGTADVPATGTVNATLKLGQGEVPITLDRALAPCAVNSFESLIKQGYFDGSPCHRLSTKGLQMLQCGDPTGTGQGGPGYKFDNEVWPELTYGRGYLAMANAGPDKADPKKGTNGSQFFIVYGEAGLSPDYTVFGSVGEPGLKVIDDIARAGDDGSFDPSPGGGKPNKEVKIEKASIVQ
ncbi:peptidylprolyl isomerase [Lentzea sp. NBRC 105346]|uniref:peptidylprolyl isomerase n=1 Tax=Lentzea sp. NBRC 105346 TaxID=3032205 RepID=UPI0024A1D112|nr:peptidylprolyl isomerase [Lentzea sp. NBRC 105346]GLZ34743.1 peptidylprolyl isomerase [Lentzea sp. NBRC 105346]